MSQPVFTGPSISQGDVAGGGGVQGRKQKGRKGAGPPGGGKGPGPPGGGESWNKSFLKVKQAAKRLAEKKSHPSWSHGTNGQHGPTAESDYTSQCPLPSESGYTTPSPSPSVSSHQQRNSYIQQQNAPPAPPSPPVPMDMPQEDDDYLYQKVLMTLQVGSDWVSCCGHVATADAQKNKQQMDCKHIVIPVTFIFDIRSVVEDKVAEVACCAMCRVCGCLLSRFHRVVVLDPTIMHQSSEGRAICEVCIPFPQFTMQLYGWFSSLCGIARGTGKALNYEELKESFILVTSDDEPVGDIILPWCSMHQVDTGLQDVLFHNCINIRSILVHAVANDMLSTKDGKPSLISVPASLDRTLGACATQTVHDLLGVIRELSQQGVHMPNPRNSTHPIDSGAAEASDDQMHESNCLEGDTADLEDEAVPETDDVFDEEILDADEPSEFIGGASTNDPRIHEGTLHPWVQMLVPILDPLLGGEGATAECASRTSNQCCRCASDFWAVTGLQGQRQP